MILYSAVVCLSVTLGAAGMWWWQRARLEKERDQMRAPFEQQEMVIKERLCGREAEIIRLQSDLKKATDQNESLNQETRELASTCAGLKSQFDEYRRSAEEKLKLVQELEENLKTNFQALSADALSKNNQTFLALADATFKRYSETTDSKLEKREGNFQQLVEPIKKSLAQVDEKIAAVEKERVGAYQGLQQQVESLLGVQLELRKETSNLVRALHSPTTRGRWGEIQLQRVVEMAGMLEYCDFNQQETTSTEENAKLRPDLVVRLPGEKTIVVDAKAPLSAYLNATEEEDEATRKELLKEHALQVRRHIQQLSQKAYWEQFKDTPEFVVLFLPGEPFFSAALEQDPTLIEAGVEQKVILATPTTLISLLRAVAYGWRGQKLAENAQQISELGKSLFVRIADLSSHMQDLGYKIESTVKTYNKTVGTLERRVLVGARRFRELEVDHSKKKIQQLDEIDVVPRKLDSSAVVQNDDALPQNDGALT